MNNSKQITVLDIFEKTVEKYPDKVAIKDINGALTYSQLRSNAQKIGAAICYNLKGKRNCPIAVFIDKGCECLVTILGILYSGNCYVPMDIKTPLDRMQSILTTLESDIVIATEESVGHLEKNGYQQPVWLYEGLLAENQEADDSEEILSDIRQKIVDTDLMYILFTSGSTGIPKGVAIRHRSVVDYVDAFTAEVPIGVEDVVGNQVPFYVDMSLKDIYMSLAVGATICVIPQKYFMSPKKLLTYLEDNGVTMLMWVPTAYSIVAQFDGLSKIKPSNLKKFLFSGEGMPISVFRYWSQAYPEAVRIQQYGPTEITGACTTYNVQREYQDGETIPIGKPFKNTGIVLLDEEDREVPVNQVDVPGEICVYGSCLAAGYYNNPEKTKEAFVQNPLIKAYPSKIYRTGDLAKWDAEGNLVFISRKDFQIKHGGRRIELGEIETAVDSIEEVKSSCCVHDGEQDIIVLFYTGDFNEKELRTALKNKIPSYMVPGKYIQMEQLPKLSNGKLDRKTMTEIACGKGEV